jgi:hypothetical protein
VVTSDVVAEEGCREVDVAASGTVDETLEVDQVLAHERGAALVGAEQRGHLRGLLRPVAELGNRGQVASLGRGRAVEACSVKAAVELLLSDRVGSFGIVLGDRRAGSDSQA